MKVRSQASPASPARAILRALPIVAIVAGLAILASFPLSELYSSWQREGRIEALSQASTSLSQQDKAELLQQARSYNEVLAGEPSELDAESVWPYERQLAEDGPDAEFAYVVIPDIALRMPVYHGASDQVLAVGVGHLEWTSLPVGGPSTHTVLTAHSGMSDMKAFDDIRNLRPGDVFAVSVLGDLYAYEVTGSEVVLPDEVQNVAIEPGEDLCTLVTCTPYGVNTHRLLVHAKRTDVPPGFADQAPSPADVVLNRRTLPFLGAAAAVAALCAGLAVRARRRRSRLMRPGGASAADTGTRG